MRHSNDLLIDRILREWSKKGMIVEGGWQAFVINNGLLNAPDLQLQEMRKAFMLGAQHLYSCLLAIMDPSTEQPTDEDLRNMESIAKELEAFQNEILRKKESLQ